MSYLRWGGLQIMVAMPLQGKDGEDILHELTHFLGTLIGMAVITKT